MTALKNKNLSKWNNKYREKLTDIHPSIHTSDTHPDTRAELLNNRAYRPIETDPKDHVPQNFGELGVGEGESPQTKVGGRVRDGAQTVLYRMNGLLHCHVAEVEFLGRKKRV